jgi:hypothetical protein
MAVLHALISKPVPVNQANAAIIIQAAASSAGGGHTRPGACDFCGDGAASDILIKLPLWKAKKWAGALLVRLIQRYGKPKSVRPPAYCKGDPAGEAAYRQFAEIFATKYAGYFLSTFIQTLYTSAQAAAGVAITVAQGQQQQQPAASGGGGGVFASAAPLLSQVIPGRFLNTLFRWVFRGERERALRAGGHPYGYGYL